MCEVQGTSAAAVQQVRLQRCCLPVHSSTVGQPSRALGRHWYNLHGMISLICCWTRARTHVRDLDRVPARRGRSAAPDILPEGDRGRVGKSAARTRSRWGPRCWPGQRERLQRSKNSIQAQHRKQPLECCMLGPDRDRTIGTTVAVAVEARLQHPAGAARPEVVRLRPALYSGTTRHSLTWR